MQLEDIVKQHPKSVALLFKHYKHGNLPLSADSLKAMVGVYGEPFAADLANAIVNEYTSNEGGTQVLSKLKSALANRRNSGRGGNRSSRPARRPIPTFDGVANTIRPNIVAPPTSASDSLIKRITANAPNVQVGPPTPENRKGKIWSGIKDALLLGAGIYGRVTEGQQQQQQQTQQNQRAQQQPKTMLWIGLGVIVVLVLALILTRKK